MLQETVLYVARKSFLRGREGGRAGGGGSLSAVGVEGGVRRVRRKVRQGRRRREKPEGRVCIFPSKRAIWRRPRREGMGKGVTTATGCRDCPASSHKTKAAIA
jgi:hypothetical protein